MKQVSRQLIHPIREDFSQHAKEVPECAQPVSATISTTFVLHSFPSKTHIKKKFKDTCGGGKSQSRPACIFVQERVHHLTLLKKCSFPAKKKKRKERQEMEEEEGNKQKKDEEEEIRDRKKGRRRTKRWVGGGKGKKRGEGKKEERL